VIPNGIRDPYPSRPDLEAALEQRFGLEHGFVLYVGGIHERKNVPGLIDAFAAFARQATYPGKLVVTGRVAGAPYQEHMKRVCDSAVRKAGLDGKVIFTGFVTDEELDTLMRRAIFLVYPSFYEGFGIPVLEAMRAGIPVITSSTTALPEVAGDAALLVDPADSEQIVAEMLRLLRTPSLRNELIEKGKRRAEGYTWEKTSLAYLALYQEVCG
jgi:glycosyltransferase involved in cell wall biosynthesis